jgi:glycosyltransferase involved in cell wall biosynthesis
MQANSTATFDLAGTAPPVVITPSSTRPVTVESSEVQPATLKVLHVVNGEHFSGAERVQSHLGRCLPDSGVAADFVSVKPGKFADLMEQHDGGWGMGHRAAMANRFDMRAAWQVRKLVRRFDYALLHAHTPRTALIASIAASLSGVPWIYHVHSPASRDSADWLSNSLNATLERLCLRRCSHVITVSESLRLDCVAKGLAEEKVSVVHNGVPAIRPQRQSIPRVGQAWTLGMVALMRPRKGLEIALDALAKLRTRYDVTLRLIGPFETREYEQEIDQQIERLAIADCVERVGFTSDVPCELGKLDALVLPSLFGEGLPMVVLEAMAAGLPVIATRVEGTPEAVTDGVEGLLAEPRHVESLAAKIAELLDGTRDWKQMSEAAIARHGKDFSDQAMARNTAAVYRELLGCH